MKAAILALTILAAGDPDGDCGGSGDPTDKKQAIAQQQSLEQKPAPPKEGKK